PPGFNPEKSIFFMPDSGGPCRFGQYNRFHKKLLKDLGINMPVYSLQQDMKFYEDLDILGRTFMKIAWQGIVAVDILDKFFRETRPYAINKKEVEDLYWESLKKIEKNIEEKRDITETLLEIKEAFKNVAVEDGEKPKVGVVGEIYVRNNRFANENLYRFLEDLGLEVWLPPITEWIYFINYTSKRWAKKLGWFRTVLRYIIETQYLKWEEKKFINLVKDILNMAEDMDVEELMDLTKKYVHPEFEGGEVLLSVGKAVEYLYHGASGIINVIPFACMPGNVVTAILKKIKEEEGIRFPTLTVPCDGQKSLGTKMRVEAFVEQVKEFFNSKERKN
ncbi:MAG: CoA activase, partial [Thermodesulfobacterium geofontis]